MSAKGNWGFSKNNFLFFIPPKIGMYIISGLTIVRSKWYADILMKLEYIYIYILNAFYLLIFIAIFVNFI